MQLNVECIRTGLAMDYTTFETEVPHPGKDEKSNWIVNDIRPILKPEIERFANRDKTANSYDFGPVAYVFWSAKKLVKYPEKLIRHADDKKSIKNEDPAKYYQGKLNDLKHGTPNKRGDNDLAQAIFYWFFREVSDPSYFKEIACHVWKNDSEIFKRFIYAKCGGTEDDNSILVSDSKSSY